MIVCFIGVSSVSAASNPYKKTSSYGINCTWYAWKMAFEKGHVALPGWGNAKTWYDSAKNSGFSVGLKPKAKSIVVWDNWTSFGHVGYVEKVSGNTLYVWDSTGPCVDDEDPEFIKCIENGVSEETDKVCYEKAKKVACKYTLSPDVYGIKGYIYLDKVPTTTRTTIVTTTKKSTTKVQTTIIKTNNNYLKDLIVDGINFPFNKELLSYDLTVPSDVEKINITGVPFDNNVKITGNGEYFLVVGKNEFKVEVMSSDKKKRVYTINVFREYEEKITSNNKTSDNNKEVKKDYKAYFIIGIDILLIFFIIFFMIHQTKYAK